MCTTVVFSDPSSTGATAITRGKCHINITKSIIMCSIVEIIVGIGVGVPLLLLLIISSLCSSLVTYLYLTRGREGKQLTTKTVQNAATTIRSVRGSIELQSNTARSV